MNSYPSSSFLWSFSSLAIVLGTVCSATAGAQDVLPFPPAPSASKAGLTMAASTCKKRLEPKIKYLKK